jgi:hypothetical protein
MKGVTMAVNPQANLPAALSGALGAITTTRQGVKKAAATVYNPPVDQTSHPEPLSGPAPAGA